MYIVTLDLGRPNPFQDVSVYGNTGRVCAVVGGVSAPTLQTPQSDQLGEGLHQYKPGVVRSVTMADLEAVLADVSYLMAMERSKAPSAKTIKKVTLPDAR